MTTGKTIALTRWIFAGKVMSLFLWGVNSKLFMGFSRQEYWSGLPFPSPVDHVLSELSYTSLKSGSVILPALFFYLVIDLAIFFLLLLLFHTNLRILFSISVKNGHWNFDRDCIKKLKVSHSVMSESLGLHGLYSAWNSPGQNTGLGSLSILQGLFPTEGSNPGLPHCRRILYQLNHKGSSNNCRDGNN